MAKAVYVITSPENGWDCLIGVVSERTPELEAYCKKSHLMILRAYDGVMTPEEFLAENSYDEDEDD